MPYFSYINFFATNLPPIKVVSMSYMYVTAKVKAKQMTVEEVMKMITILGYLAAKMTTIVPKTISCISVDMCHR